ncbi:helix-turn-helix domain-containing protein [Chryseobacterium sp. JUb7]|uniref:helix-turn-helix domain-containing protein n=1 Tax=Chryseobacterium sp. JUb7 TaxID=2940599 RepID=UPI00216902E7|nr:helix-turn-helix domain-containing protein [Chryseobacterium sp. JUb7]MCS3529908.1 DNA-binding transcriptional regulator YiaG [Chryseobacterium sp. JUb7]
MEKSSPNYKQIYCDIINRKHPNKKIACETILKKEEVSILDVIKLNNIIFGMKDRETNTFDQQHRSYDEQSIKEILEYQEKNDLNNTQLANHFKLSRNTVAKWKKHFKHWSYSSTSY